MDESLRLGRIGGIQIGANWSLLIVFFLIVWSLAGSLFPQDVPGQTQAAYWLAAVVAAFLFYASLLAHELGHAVVARRMGIAVEGITLWLFGGVARLRGEASSPGGEARIALAGPVVSFGLAVLFGLATYLLDPIRGAGLVEGATAWLAGTNLLLAIFNLIPAYPLDGGRVLRAFLWRRNGDRLRATAQAARGGRLFGYLLIAYGILGFFFGGSVSGVWSVFLGWFILSAARSEESHVLIRGALSGIRVADVMTPNPVVAPGWITVEEFLNSYVFTHRFTAFPLKTFEGKLDGLITLSRLKDVAPEARRATRVRDLACGLDKVATSAPFEPLINLLDRTGSCGDGRVLVLQGGELVGIVSPTDINRALRMAALRGAPLPT